MFVNDNIVINISVKKQWENDKFNKFQSAET